MLKYHTRYTVTYDKCRTVFFWL